MMASSKSISASQSIAKQKYRKRMTIKKLNDESASNYNCNPSQHARFSFGERKNQIIKLLIVTHMNNHHQNFKKHAIHQQLKDTL